MALSKLSRRHLLGALAAAPLLRPRPTRAQNLKGDEALSKVLLDDVEDGRWQPVAPGLASPRGACADAEGTVYVGDPARGVVHRIGLDGVAAPVSTGVPPMTGLRLAADGRLFVASPSLSGGGNKTRGRRAILVLDAKRMSSASKSSALSPFVGGVDANDLVVTRSGLLFFTVPAKGQVGVVTPDRKVRVVANGLAAPNGLVLSPDEGTLAVAEGGGAHVWAFRVEANGDLTNGSPWMDLRTPVGRQDSGADGMTVDAEGRYYACSHEGIQMFDWTGRMGGVIAKPSPKPIASCIFGGAGRAYLYVCAADGVYRRKTKTAAA